MSPSVARPAIRRPGDILRLVLGGLDFLFLMSPPDMVWQPWLIGMRRAMEAMLTGDSMTGTDSVDAGFANRAFPESKLGEAVLDIAQRVAKIPADLLALN
jgi:enoyl-CoA hydratase